MAKYFVLVWSKRKTSFVIMTIFMFILLTWLYEFIIHGPLAFLNPTYMIIATISIVITYIVFNKKKIILR